MDVNKKTTSPLKKMMDASSDRGYVRLPYSSKKTGVDVKVLCRRIGLREIAALELPDLAKRLVDKMVEEDRKAVEGGGELTETPASIVKELWGGMTSDAVGSLTQFMNVVCCRACVDPDTRIYYTQDEVDADPDRGVLVWDMNNDDAGAIYDWVFDPEAMKARAGTSNK